ncbi:unnamed protein product [Darwinula stevensoni]|uniref:EB domain-containing protein n=1 Tax=Darwinula stevensoni TaxID=69355 RepID=A0A7R8XLV7_9CRUS|nr:unnamed protein product [Darwinula stevensoni]CAG0894747.1 unnamed protein product [Darwinula stevensoni]
MLAFFLLVLVASHSSCFGKNSGLGDSCDSDGECKPRHSVCVDGTCECEQSHLEEGKHCKIPVGELCRESSESDCVNHAACVGDGWRTCQCQDAGQVVFVVERRRCRRILGIVEYVCFPTRWDENHFEGFPMIVEAGIASGRADPEVPVGVYCQHHKEGCVENAECRKRKPKECECNEDYREEKGRCGELTNWRISFLPDADGAPFTLP